jgi:hypothetical protein
VGREGLAFDAMNNGGQLLEILVFDVCVRNHRWVIPEMVESAGISKSSVSRQFIEANG